MCCTAPTPENEAKARVIAEGDLPLVTEFIRESQELLESAGAELETIEANPEDAEAIHALYEKVHRIENIAGFLNLH